MISFNPDNLKAPDGDALDWMRALIAVVIAAGGRVEVPEKLIKEMGVSSHFLRRFKDPGTDTHIFIAGEREEEE